MHNRCMSHIQFPKNVEFERAVVVSHNRECEHCGGFLYVRDTKHRYVWSKTGAMHLLVAALHCPDPSCKGHKVTVGQEAELAVAMPYWSVTWDLLVWMGHQRFTHHLSVPQIRAQLADQFGVRVSADWVEDYLRRYQAMVAAREADVEQWASDYESIDDVILTMDGLQPEKGHETLYVVRELRAKRVWFAEPLLSSSNEELHRLFVRARQIAARLGKPIRCWMSDKQEVFVTQIAQVFPGVPHRYCANHFLRDLAEPVMEADSHAKVQMRRKVRGLRNIEKRLLKEAAEERAASAAANRLEKADDTTEPVAAVGPEAAESADAADRQVVLDYCAAVRGILNDDQGGPLQPPGLRMAEALEQVDQSIERSLMGKKGGLAIKR